LLWDKTDLSTAIYSHSHNANIESIMFSFHSHITEGIQKRYLEFKTCTSYFAQGEQEVAS